MYNKQEARIENDNAQAKTPITSSPVGKTGNGQQQKHRTKKRVCQRIKSVRCFYWSLLEASQEIRRCKKEGVYSLQQDTASRVQRFPTTRDGTVQIVKGMSVV
eukprot:scaffold399260_cov63-Attheya_sp.AAC.1